MRSLLILLTLALSCTAWSNETFRHFGRCDAVEAKAGCQTNIAGFCDPYTQQGNCIYQCWCPAAAVKKLNLIDEILQLDDQTLQFDGADLD